MSFYLEGDILLSVSKMLLLRSMDPPFWIIDLFCLTDCEGLLSRPPGSKFFTYILHNLLDNAFIRNAVNEIRMRSVLFRRCVSYCTFSEVRPHFN